MTVTIGIPFLNAKAFLADSIRSVFAQTYEDWELLLVDDGSTDGSLEIARAVRDSRVRVLADGRNWKLARRLNQIAAESHRELVARMDADDMMVPDRLQKEIAVLNSDPSIDLVSTGVYSVTNSLALIGCRWHDSLSITMDDLLAKRGCGIVHAAIVGRRAWFLRNPYDDRLEIAQDYELWLRSMKRKDCRISLIQEPLYIYREQSSATAEKMLRAYANNRKMAWRYGGIQGIPLIGRTFLKSAAVTLLSAANKTEWLLRRRSREVMKEADRAQYQRHLDKIFETKVPGFD